MSSSRERILDIAWRMVSDAGPEAVTMSAVARESGVSRQMAYLHFESRAGLLTAMARHHDARSGFVERVAAAERREPAEAVEALMRAWLAYVPEILPVARALEAAVTTGDEGATAYHDRMGDLLAAFRRVLARAPLREGWTADAAADWIWARTHPSAWDHLVVQRGWPPDRFVERVVQSTLSEVILRSHG